MDNFKQIRSLLRYETLGDFYFIQVFKRRKDNPELPKSEKLIKSYSVFSLEEYDALEPRIMELCEENNARAYFRLNKRNSNGVALHMIKACTDAMIGKQTNHMYKIYDAVCGRFNAEKNPTWVVDVDSKELKDLLNVRGLIRTLTGERETAIIKTLGGWHIITRPFNRLLFAQQFPLVDIHKDNPTLLYFKV